MGSMYLKAARQVSQKPGFFACDVGFGDDKIGPLSCTFRVNGLNG